MRSFTLACLLLALSVPQLAAESLKKPYFAATHPGTWAKYESSWEMPGGMAGTNIYTYIRAADSDGRVRIELDTETKSGPGAGMVSRQLFVMEPGFDLAKNFMNHTGFTEANIAQSGDGPASLMQDDVIQIVRQSAGDLTNSVTFKGRAKRQGRDCDHYSYSYKSGGPRVTHQEGEICLDESVPFGIVHQTGRVKDADGRLTSTFEQKLLDSGTGKSATAALLEMTPRAKVAAAGQAAPKAAPSLDLLQAYHTEKIRLAVEVEPGSGGKRLKLFAVNKTKEAFDLVVPKGSVTIPGDGPLPVLELVLAKQQSFSLAPGATSPAFAAGQSGTRGATEGNFQLTVYEGEALFQGSVTMGPLE